MFLENNMSRRYYLHFFTAFSVGLLCGMNQSSLLLSRKNIFHTSTTTSLDSAADTIERLNSEVEKLRNLAEERLQSYSELSNTIKLKDEELDNYKRLKTNNHNEKEKTTKITTEEEQPSSVVKLQNPNKHPICQSLPFPTPSTNALWNQNIPNILMASKLPNDRRFKFHDFTAEVLQIITPRLHRSVKALPYDWSSLEYVMDIGWQRYKYLQLSESERQLSFSLQQPPPRPLKILVMGGSLLVGTNCRRLLTELKLSGPIRLPKRDCTWSNRLGHFLNKYFGANENLKLFEVAKVAMGGTNTATGNTIFTYDLIPEEVRNPDIIINAYSTNDMHILTMMEAQSSNITLRDKVFEMIQNFVRDVMQSSTTICKSSDGKNNKSQPPPLLLHMDDYLGNEQRSIWETTELSQGVQVLANYYGFTSMSYADVVRDVVYGDTYESWLSANWWETGSFEREIHPGMGMHIASTWVTVYNLLNLVTTYCSIPIPKLFNDINQYDESEAVKVEENQNNIVLWPPLRHDVAQAQGKPQERPLGIPPLLTKDLLIENVTTLWRQNSDEIKSRCNDVVQQQKSQNAVKCPFSWVSGLSLQQNNQTWVDEYFHNQATEWKGWELRDEGGKLGFVPSTIGNTSTLILEFDVTQPIRSITVFFMKSYGAKWEGSRFRARILEYKDNKNWIPTKLREMVGIHNKSTSEMYTEPIHLQESIPIGHKFRFEGKLIGGTTFKLMGLAVCS